LTETAAAGVRLVSAADGAAIQNNPPEDLVILDVRTPEEFAEGHIDGAIMVDFYSDDFADQLAELDPDVPYLLYCRSGNRSGQTAVLLEDLGFSDVADVDGGVLGWLDAGLPLVAG
jgi:rhodanese-related sulfurtransferase